MYFIDLLFNLHALRLNCKDFNMTINASF